MDELLERDVIANTPTQDSPPTPHTHEVSSFVATPRTDQPLLQKMLSWFKSELKPGMHIVHKDGDARRLMFIVTSNSYMDREGETITSAALKAYEDSCYPGDDIFHCDNPLLWWHDDDVVMGEIIGVNYSEPFLIEVARELDNPVSKVLFDFAEANGDNAGASHRFGYREQDKQADGTYTHIFKQETSYLPERHLAANLGTYAGVMKHMASAQSDKRLNEIFAPLGVPNAAEMLHAKSGELAKKLEELGIQHKALNDEKAKPPLPPADVPAVVAEEVAEEVVEEDAKADAPADMAGFMTLMNQIYGLVMEMVDGQMGLMDSSAALAKELKEFKETRTAEKAAEKVTLETLQQQINVLEKRLNLQPRSVQHEVGGDAEAAKTAIDKAEKSRADGELQDTPFGKLKPAPDYGK